MVHPVSIVWPCPLDVDAYVERGRELEVPRPPYLLCSGPTGHWSGYKRHLRDGRDRLIWIPRVRQYSRDTGLLHQSTSTTQRWTAFKSPTRGSPRRYSGAPSGPVRTSIGFGGLTR